MGLNQADASAAADNAGRRIQVVASPYVGEMDFSPLEGFAHGNALLDTVSIADLLRNAFVYPPHTIYRHVKTATLGFDPEQDLHRDPQFRFTYRASPPRPSLGSTDQDHLVETYHHFLCDAVARSTAPMRAPWLLQSGGKDSTSLAIAVAETAPQTTCLTYLGGQEENEVASARFVARRLGLHHETLVCNPGRAYDRYLALLPNMPLLTADFATLSYADVVTEIVAQGGDGVLDGLGSDIYFGTPLNQKQRLLAMLAWRLRLPPSVFSPGMLNRNFALCFALGTVQMDAFERFFPGSRFSDTEVDALLGCKVAAQSRQRLELFRAEIVAADTQEGRRRLSVAISEASGAFAKGLYTASALSLRVAYPFCDPRLSEWVFRDVPQCCLVDPSSGASKVLVRDHIARHFQKLPYVSAAKGSFRFDLCGLARQRFDQVHAFAIATQALVPGARGWLEANRHRLDNKYFASKFNLLAITLPWLHSRMDMHGPSNLEAHWYGPGSFKR
jgi:asparagine synthetase B (glutamine-hydrolysing)